MIPTDKITAKIDFTLTNPPFYESQEEMDGCAKQKSRPPMSACTGAPNEMVYAGGEVAFVSKILEESLTHRDEIQWYTSMLGKLSSVEPLVEKLRAKGIDNFAVTEFVQGNKTKRWAIGWSFGPMRPSNEAARGLHGDKLKKMLPPVIEAEVIRLPLDLGVGTIEDKIYSLMGSLELVSWNWDKQTLSGVGRSRENVWSRAWRRKKAREQKEGVASASAITDEPGASAFGFEVRMSVQTSAMGITCTWREGHDSVMFESFCGFLKTRLKLSE